ncbi:hypothetical protein PGIGA_G00031550 [Pangasianodon gigas]|uniref:Uncharacterized protein n=1 Tax=Pangasianodon gigas TaxID=30993 RepID=A0ACC5WXS8_PANGG|nr:hypothetical protein [Pangasianodon gigas]
MTSRIVKTYSRKAGDGTSKFDEVLSNKRATLSTKWGETTYKAQLGSKRPGMKADRPDRTKKPKMAEDDGSEDPFGFDSDDESRPVSSRNASKSPAKLGPAEAGLTLEPNSRVNQPASVEAAAPGRPPARTSSTLSADKSAARLPEDSGKFFSSSTSGKTHSCSSENAERHSYSWYRNASESDRKPLAQTTTLKSEKSEDKDSFDAWGAIVGLGSRSTSPLSASRDPPSSTWTSGSSLLTKPPVETCVTDVVQGDLDLPVEPSESEDHSQSLLRTSNCRTYCRPNKSKPSASGGTSNSDGAGSTKSGDGEGKSRGRMRDYTVLHPSSMSACNVTIQDSMERGMEEYTPSAPAADPGEAGRLRKKAEPETKPARSRSTQSKTKKESKLDLFGFDDGDTPSAEGDSASSGSSNYKIKYFGFDELSNSDSDGAEDEDKPRKTRRMASVPAEVSGAASVDFSRPKASQENSSTGQKLGLRRDPPEMPEVNSRAASEAPKRPQAKPQEKAKESSRRIFSGPKRSPTKAVYNARHWNQPEPEELPPPPPSASQAAPLYTVVQHVKHFNDVVEFGENQEFTDDFEYLATGLKSGQPLNTRCLSVISLATRCALPSFRMHLRARGKVAQVFKTLNDAPQHPNLALCTASLMYILSRDRLNMDLDRASLELMIRLLELEQDKTADSQLSAKEMSKVKERIRKLCETVHNKHLDLENITTGHLAMETLLSLTSKRAGDWFKEELRLLGGLDHIVDKVKECVENLSCEDDKENLVASLWGAERCLRVLESVTVHNPENQAYLIAYKDSQLIVSSAKALRHCEEMIQRYSRDVSRSSSGSSQPHCSVGKAVQDCMRAVIGVLLNLTHDNEWGSTKTGEQEDLIITALNCVLRVPQYLPQEQRFDIRVLGLGLLINLVEYSARNRHCLVEMEMDGGELWDSICVSDKEELNTEGSLSAIAALVKLFLQREHAAVLAEAETDDFINDVPTEALDQSGEWQETSGEIQWVASEDKGADEKKKKKDEDEEELDLNKALQHAGKHMEDSIVASYTALLLGCLCQGSPMNVSTVRENLPKGDFSIMTEMLKKFLNFMNLTCDMGTTGQKSISRVIDYLEHC